MVVTRAGRHYMYLDFGYQHWLFVTFTNFSMHNDKRVGIFFWCTSFLPFADRLNSLLLKMPNATLMIHYNKRIFVHCTRNAI
jgi:hypothetical protein